MRFWKICLTLLVLIIAIGAVSATDKINDTTISNGGQGIIETAQDTPYLEDEIATFTNLNYDIKNSKEYLEMTTDYLFDAKNDKPHSILVEEDNYVIYGNNHIIDADFQSSILNITGKNVTLTDLTFTNAENENGALYISGSVILFNVTFINNIGSDYGGAVINFGSLECNDCTFIDNYAEKGSAIYSDAGTLDMYNCYFTSQYPNKYGSVYSKDSDITIDECDFTNTSSKYAPAIYIGSSSKPECEVIINNTRFTDLSASETGGAIAIKVAQYVAVVNSIFTNTSSTKNGGAIFADMAGDEPYTGEMVIFNSTFAETSSNFGGAYLQLGGTLSISDSFFTDCVAEFNGGAIYLSDVSADLQSNVFTGNIAKDYDEYESYGGAVYADTSTFDLTKSEFNNNNAYQGAAIYSYDSKYYIGDLTFNNNGNAIRTVFDKKGSKYGNLYGSDDIYEDDFNNTYYLSSVITPGMQITLLNNSTDISNIPARYDLREVGLVSPVKNQGSMGACWTFGMNAALESAVLKSLGIEADFSENHMQNTMLKYSVYGLSSMVEGGISPLSIGYLLSWLGALPQEHDTYDELGKISPIITSGNDIHILDVIFVAPDTKSVGNPAIKEAILKYGALQVDLVAAASEGQEYEFYNEATFSQYNPNHLTPDHAVCVVGWDDNYPKEKFSITPPGNGAWIIKNSWGADWGDGGYMYLSYYDQTFCAFPNDITACAYGIIIENDEPYVANYQYDFTGLNDFTTYTDGSKITFMNKYVAEEDDLLAAVGTYFNKAGIDYSIEIAVNDNVLHTQNGVSPFYGYHTIKLDKYIYLKKGDEFSVFITSNAMPTSKSGRMHYEEGVSMIVSDDDEWTDIYQTSEEVACIKAYTLPITSIKTQNVKAYYSEKKIFEVTVKNANANVTVFISDDIVLNSISNEKGIATFTLPLLDLGTYMITTCYNSTSIVSTLDVLSRFSGDKNIAMDYYDGTAFKARVYADGGAFAKNQKVVIKIDKKTYTAYTDGNGWVNFKIPNTITPGKHTITATYAKQTISHTLQVKQILKSTKTVTVKKSAKKLVLKATLKTSKGKAIKSKTITFKLNGKTYTAKTNSNGVAQKTLNKNVINKLKKGKKYTLKITYLKNTIQTTVNVK